MRKKQLGAAPEDRPTAVERRAGRLRAQPGFRTAAIAFVLTVLLGIGGSAAYAYWSQSRSGTITGTTVPPVLPAPGVLACETGSPNRVEWAPVAAADPEAVYILTFELPSRTRKVSYAVKLDAPLNSRKRHSVEPTKLSELFEAFGDAGSIYKPVDLIVSVRTGIVRVPPVTKAAVAIAEADILVEPEGSATLHMKYYSAGVWGNYPCR